MTRLTKVFIDLANNKITTDLTNKVINGDVSLSALIIGDYLKNFGKDYFIDNHIKRKIEIGDLTQSQIDKAESYL